MNFVQPLKFKHSTMERVLSGLGVLGIGGGVFIVRYFNPVAAGFFPQCPFHAMTGLNCPGCGMTRGFNALFRGDFLTALHFNALLPFFALFFGYLTLSLFLIAARGRGLTWQIFRPTLVYLFLAVTIIFAVARNLPFYPFNLLAI
jgi:hypothetical protein